MPQGRQASVLDKLEVLNYHRDHVKLNPAHSQADTRKHFTAEGRVPISKSSLSRWVEQELQIRYDADLLTERTRKRSRSYRGSSKTSPQVVQFLEENSHILRCLEMFYTQNVLANEDDEIPYDREVLDKFNEFKILYGEQDSLQKGYLIDNKSWPDAFFSSLELRLEPLRLSMKQQRQFNNESKSLRGERDRLQRALREYDFDHIYQFNEVLIDVFSILHLTDATKSAYLENLRYPEALDSDTNMVTLGVIGNLAGSDFPDPLMISNLENSTNTYNKAAWDPYYYYDPEGFNTRKVFGQYLAAWNSRLRADQKQVALLLDSYWCHYGLGESSLGRFSNIEIVFVSSRYDKTSSIYHRVSLRLPLSLGFERLVRVHVKQALYKKLLRERRAYGFNNALQDGMGIVNCVRFAYEDTVSLVQKDYSYLMLYKLGIVGSRIFEEDKPSIQDVLDEDTDDEHDNTELYLRLPTFIRAHIPLEFKNEIVYSVHSRSLVLRKDEHTFLDFAKKVALVFEKRRRKLFRPKILRRIVRYEFTLGHNEVKFNKNRSMPDIVERVRRQLHHEQACSTPVPPQPVSDAEILDFLGCKLQPLLYHKRHGLHTQEALLETLRLFNRFYYAYMSSTTELPGTYRVLKRRQITGLAAEKPRTEDPVSGSDPESSSEDEPHFLRRPVSPTNEQLSSPIRTKRVLRSVTPSSPPTYRTSFSDELSLE